MAKYGITPVDTKWVDTDKAFEGEPMQIRSRTCAREFKSDDRPFACRDSSIGGAESHHNRFQRTTKKHFQSCTSTCHVHISKRRLRGPVLIRLPVEDRMGSDAGKMGLMKKTMYGGTRPAITNVIGKSTSGTGASNWDSAQRICFTTKRTECRV